MIRFLIDIYILLIIVDAILSFFPQLSTHPIILQLRRVTGFTLKPIRKYLPPDLPIDPSPIVAILLLNLLKALW
jgi:YggT family protein